jgi:hypothetical protein
MDAACRSGLRGPCSISHGRHQSPVPIRLSHVEERSSAAHSRVPTRRVSWSDEDSAPERLADPARGRESLTTHSSHCNTMSNLSAGEADEEGHHDDDSRTSPSGDD